MNTLVIPVNEWNLTLFTQDKKGNIELNFGINKNDVKLKHGEMKSLTNEQSEEMKRLAKVVIKLDRDSLINLGAFCMSAAKKSEIIAMFRKAGF